MDGCCAPGRDSIGSATCGNTISRAASSQPLPPGEEIPGVTYKMSSQSSAIFRERERERELTFPRYVDERVNAIHAQAMTTFWRLQRLSASSPFATARHGHNSSAHQDRTKGLRLSGRIGTEFRRLVRLNLRSNDLDEPASRRGADCQPGAEHFGGDLAFVPDDLNEPLGTYGDWLDPSRSFRQYLWTYTEGDEDRARTLITVLGASKVKAILKYLAAGYWERYLGWPICSPGSRKARSPPSRC